MKIVMYHYLRNFNKNYPKLKYLNKKKFIKQLNFFERKYGVVNSIDWKKLLKNNFNTNLKKVLLTFDDGLLEHFNFVYKELKKKNFIGIFFVPSYIFEKKNNLLNVHKIHLLLAKIPIKKLSRQLNLILLKFNYNLNKRKLFNHSYSKHQDIDNVKNFKRILNYDLSLKQSDKILNELIKINKINFKKNNFYLSKKNLKIMSQNKMIIGSHSHNHPVLSNLSYKDQLNEITNSVKILSKVIKKKIILFSYPFGIKNTFNLNTFKALKKNKIKFAFIANKMNSINKYKNYAINRQDCNEFYYGKSG